jgi:hypothetical protein
MVPHFQIKKGKETRPQQQQLNSSEWSHRSKKQVARRQKMDQHQIKRK